MERPDKGKRFERGCVIGSARGDPGALAMGHRTSRAYHAQLLDKLPRILSVACSIRPRAAESSLKFEQLQRCRSAWLLNRRRWRRIACPDRSGVSLHSRFESERRSLPCRFSCTAAVHGHPRSRIPVEARRRFVLEIQGDHRKLKLHFPFDLSEPSAGHRLAPTSQDQATPVRSQKQQGKPRRLPTTATASFCRARRFRQPCRGENFRRCARRTARPAIGHEDRKLERIAVVVGCHEETVSGLYVHLTK